MSTPSSTDSPAAALSRLRWAGTTKTERRAEMAERRAQQTILGDTPEAAAARSERARKAAKASAAVRSAAAKKKKPSERKSNAGKAIRSKQKKSVKN